MASPSNVAVLSLEQMMNNMGGDDDVDLPEVDGADDVSTLFAVNTCRAGAAPCTFIAAC